MMYAGAARGMNEWRLVQAVRRALRRRGTRLRFVQGMSLAFTAGLGFVPAQAELPVICVSGASCGNSSSVIDKAISTGTSFTTTGNAMTINQTTANAVLHWQSFNISSGSSVKFNQPGSDSVALNRIYQNSASQILGNLTANGRVYLLNQNGIVFGNGAQVNVAGLLASSLDISTLALNADGSTNLLNAGLNGAAAFQLYGTGISGDVSVLQGASITTTEGGQVLIFAPNVYNQGNISTPGGQTMLAAGTSIYLAKSEDDNLRGMLVAVDASGMADAGTVTNGDVGNATISEPAQLVGQLVAERGNITLAGLAVNQLGRVSATTSISENGSIRLLAHSGGSAAAATDNSYTTLNATQGGTLTLGQQSVTEVQLSTATAATVDSTEQPKSSVDLQGKLITILDDAQVTATSGSITAKALDNPASDIHPGSGTVVVEGNRTDGSRIYIADGATLDVSGAHVTKSMESNVIAVDLYADELADSPVQRDGVLYKETVYVDVREGTEVADISGQISLIERDVAERNLTGGSIKLESQGDVILDTGATLDISGGSINYESGYISTSKLLGANGTLYDIADADPNRTYQGVVSTGTYTVTDSRWGVTRTYAGTGGKGRYEQGYVEGKDAGSVHINAPLAVIDGDIKAAVQVGRYQRELSTALASSQQYRAYDELPRGGRLQIGSESQNSDDQVSGDVEFVVDAAAPLQNEDGTEFDPLSDALPAGVDATRLRSGLFGEDRIARIDIHSNGTVTVPEAVHLDLGAQGEFAVQAAQIAVAGDIKATSGSIALEALQTLTQTAGMQQVQIAGTAMLDVSGQWVNDSQLLNPSGELAPVLIDGGTVDISATGGSVSLAAGSVVDASGGARADREGHVTAGTAGSIKVSAERNEGADVDQNVRLDLDGELRAYGFAQGGSLSISAPEICITAAADCNDEPGTLAWSAGALAAGGFGDIELVSNERGLTVKSGTQIDLQQSNRLLRSNALRLRSGSDLDRVADISVLPDDQRAATHLSLRAEVDDLAPGLGYNNTTFAAASQLVIEQGARITADAAASISLQSNTSMVMDGALTTHGGEINLTLDNSLMIVESLDAQGIWLGSNAVLDVSGVALFTPNGYGLRTGEVLDGGTVNITTQRGSVIANAGSRIDASGTAAMLDISSAGGGSPKTTAQWIASNGGAVNVTAADAIVLGGEMRASAGGGSATAMGGELTVSLDANSRKGDTPLLLLPIEEHSIVVTQSANAVTIAPGSALPSGFANQALLSADGVMEAGFSSVTLSAETTTFGTQGYALGNVEFDGDVDLSLGRELVIDAARVTGNGNVNIDAAYVALGHDSANFQQVESLGATQGSLNISAAFIEAIGNSTIDGFSTAILSSAGDLRLRGIQQTGSGEVQGSLATHADLTLRADQVYATTLSDFDVSVLNSTDGVLQVEGTGEARDTVLSAASHLTLNAHTIEQAGVLRAPFGTIELNAQNLTLQYGSLTSTSAEGATILFGQVQAGSDWVYELNGQTLVLGETTRVPEQQVLLNGAAVSTESGSVIDVSGGGDLLGYEFVSGTGGSVDVLSAESSTTRFAIVPALSASYAAYDTQESQGSTLSVGDTIHLSGGVDGLPEGDYVLLPARYALMEGAYVVEVAAGYTDLKSGTVLEQLNGSHIVSGYTKVANTDYAESRSSGFLITSGEVLAQEAQYDTHLASEFFSEQASINNTVVPRLAQDAGVVSIAATAQLNIDGELRARAQEGGRGAAVDITADNLLVSDTADGVPGTVVISATDLNGLNAESVLLGGSRSSTTDGVRLDVNASTVTVAGDAVLSAPELLLAATDTVRVQSGASLTASGEVKGNTYLLEGDGAALRLAAGEQAVLQRDNESNLTGSLVLEQGAQLTAIGGALALDASLDVSSAAGLSLDDGSLSLGASRINLTTDGVTAAGLTLDAQTLNAMALNELVLVSRSSIDLLGAVQLDVNELQLNAAGLRSEGGGTASISADTLVLTNTADRTDAAATGGGNLMLTANSIVIGDGTQQMAGYETVTMAATDEIRGDGQGGVAVQGGLSLSTPVLLAAQGADITLSATGALQLTAPATGTAQSQDKSQELGGELTLQGASVQLAGRIEAAAGTVKVTATMDDVVVAAGAVIDVAGRVRDFDDSLVAADAGSISLVAEQGDVLAQAGSTLDLSAVEDGAAGTLEIDAVNGTASLVGTLQASAQQASDSGRAAIDVARLDDFSALNGALNAGGFLAQRELRQRTGDVTVTTSDTLTAQSVKVTADTGSIIVNGVIDARGAEGGDVVLSAAQDVSVNGTVLAAASSSEGDGGTLQLLSDNGSIHIISSARVDLSAGADDDTDGGELKLRLQRAVLEQTFNDTDSSNDALVLTGTLTGIEKTSVEAYERYTDEDGVITAAETIADISNLYYQEASEFIGNQAATIKAALGRTNDSSFSVLAGIEIQSTGDLTLDSNWNLYDWRFGDAPGVLTLRAAGSLIFDSSLSDGFAAVTGTATSAAYMLPEEVRNSWSYRLIAGADQGSADLLAVGNNEEADVTITAGTVLSSTTNPSTYHMVRTGNGSIEVAAAGDFILGNQASVLYTAGVNSNSGYKVVGALSSSNTNAGRAYPVDGGDISIDVKGDIQGAQTNQLYTDWLWRVGKSKSTAPNGLATAWTINYARFMQNVGALGGGDVSIRAGGSISDLSVSIPSIGQQVGGTRASDSVVKVIGGGDLAVSAGGDILGGNYMVGLGQGELQAGGSVAQSVNTGLYPILGLGDGSWQVHALDDLGIEAVLNPTLVPQAQSQGSITTQLTVFSTYADSSSVELQSVAGDALLSNDIESVKNFATSIDWGRTWDKGEALMIYAPNLDVSAMSGDVILSGSTTLYPAAGAVLTVYADQNIRRDVSVNDVKVVVPDVDPNYLPTVADPAEPLNTLFDAYQQALGGSGPNAHANTPVHAADAAEVHMVAREGDIDFRLVEGTGDPSMLSFSMPARIVAGGDIIDLPLTVQHDDAGDITSVVAGGDIYYTVARGDSGIILSSGREIAVDGPGNLLILADGNIDLQTSLGISSRGDLVNTNLSDTGASINVLAGLNGQRADYTAFTEKYLVESDSYAAQLDNYVAQLTGVEPASHAAALATFSDFSAAQKAPLIFKVLLAELRGSAETAASAEADKHNDYSQGFAAMNTLFPDEGKYAGDIALYFSRIYTQDGGDITLLTPGGGVNAGLASPPSAFGITKDADELGIVTQRVGDIGIVMDQDLLVNESRVFAVDDSDIVVWSSNGDIDAGRGAKTAISAPAAVISYDLDGHATVIYSAALAGSGIQARASTADHEEGDVVLAAPRGVVNASDAGIVAGNLTIAATAVLGADNITVTGVSVGVPVDAGGVGASLAGVAAAVSGATTSATTAMSPDDARAQQQNAPIAAAALSWLEVFVVGLGEDTCKQDDMECLKRQNTSSP